MLLWLWNNMRGYVRILVTGFAVERFINMAAHRGIYIWDTEKTDEGTYMNVSVKAVKQLRDVAHKTRCRIKIKRKEGYPFLAHRYRKRKILVGGIVFFIVFMFVLSSFIWKVDVVGNKRIYPNDIIDFCEQNGLKPGVSKSDVDEKKLALAMMTHYEDLAWVNVYIKGTRATITVSETLEKKQMMDKSAPCNVVAQYDGLITNIVTAAGRPLVKQNDVVKKGDVLVSGEIVVKEDETGVMKDYVHANSMVWARMYEEINFDVPFEYERKAYTGETKTTFGFIIGDKRFEIPFLSIPLMGKEFESYDRSTSRNQLHFGEDYPLPVIFLTHTYKEFVNVAHKRTIEQAKELADYIVNGRILNEFDFAADVIGKDFRFGETLEGLRTTVTVTIHRRIDNQQPLEIQSAPEAPQEAASEPTSTPTPTPSPEPTPVPPS